MPWIKSWLPRTAQMYIVPAADRHVCQKNSERVIQPCKGLHAPPGWIVNINSAAKFESQRSHKTMWRKDKKLDASDLEQFPSPVMISQTLSHPFPSFPYKFDFLQHDFFRVGSPFWTAGQPDGQGLSDLTWRPGNSWISTADSVLAGERSHWKKWCFINEQDLPWGFSIFN